MEEQRKPQFPPQTQPQQPGKEYVMCPLPLAINPDYKPSEKLNVRALLFCFSFSLNFLRYISSTHTYIHL